MERDKRKEIITCGMVRLVIVLLLMFLVCGCSNETTISGPFKVDNASFDSLSDAVSFLKSHPEEDSNVIMLTRDTSDSGAEIKGIPGFVTIDLQTFTYTVSNEGTGIVIDNQDGSVSITGGIIQAENGKKGMGEGNTDKALITVKSNLELTDTVVNVDTGIDAIEISSGVLSLNGRTDIQTLAGRNFISARGSSKVNVCSEDVIMTGRMALSDSAEVDLGHATLNLTKEIIIEGTDASVHMDECTIVVAKPVILEQPSVLNVVPFNESLVLTVKTEVDPSDDNLVFQWYDETDNPIEGATSSELICGPYDEKCIHSFYCKVKRVVTIGGQEIASDECWTDVVNVAFTGLPTVYINTPEEVTITREFYVAETSLRIVSPDESESMNKTIQIKGRGNASWTGTGKKGYNLKFEKKTKVLGMDEAKKWSIVSNYFDKSLLRNWLSSYFAHSVLQNNEWNPSYKFFDFVLNGEYRGSYVVIESIQINRNRINVDSIEEINEEEDFNKGGFILEIDVRKDASHCFVSDIFNLPFTLKDPDFDNKDATVYVEHMKSIVNTVEAELSASGFSQKGIQEIESIDVASFVDWYIVEEFAKNLDADFYTSVYMYYNPTDSKLHMGPHWDFDHSFGNYVRRYSSDKDCSNPEGYWINNCQGGYISWYEFLLSNDSFMEAVKERWREIRSRIEGVYEVIDEQVSRIKASAEYNFVLWDILGKDIACDAPGWQNRTSYMDEVNYLKDWIRLRAEWLDSQWLN